jgi:hypothetical protein
MSQEPPMTRTAPENDVLDVAWLAAPSHRSRFRIGLLVVLALLLVFLGGVQVQKRWGSTDSSATAGRPTGGSFPAGGFSGFGPTSGNATAQTRTGSATTPALIGKLTGIHGRTWTVQDLGGTTHTVRVTGTTTLTRSLTRATGPIRTGSSVTVQGTTHGKTVSATAVTIR